LILCGFVVRRADRFSASETHSFDSRPLDDCDEHDAWADAGGDRDDGDSLVVAVVDDGDVVAVVAAVAVVAVVAVVVAVVVSVAVAKENVEEEEESHSSRS
jgi:hypothetical protein